MNDIWGYKGYKKKYDNKNFTLYQKEILRKASPNEKLIGIRVLKVQELLLDIDLETSLTSVDAAAEVRPLVE